MTPPTPLPDLIEAAREWVAAIADHREIMDLMSDGRVSAAWYGESYAAGRRLERAIFALTESVAALPADAVIVSRDLMDEAQNALADHANDLEESNNFSDASGIDDLAARLRAALSAHPTGTGEKQ